MISYIKKNILPISFTAVIVCAMMYSFIPELIIPLAAATFILCSLAFYFFSIIKEKGKYTPVFYIACLAFILLASYFLLILASSEPLYALYNFITFGKVGDRSSQLIVFVIFINSVFLFSSFVFYFTSIIYRSSIVFIISILPCALYEKRLQQIPIVFVILLVSFYFAVMVHCKQLKTIKNSKIIMDSSYKKSLFVFIILTVIISVALPKPETTPFRSTFLSLFQDVEQNGSNNPKTRGSSNKSNIRQQYQAQSDEIIFRVKADEPLYLRFQVFDLYENDVWRSYEKDEFTYGSRDWRNKVYCNNYLENIKILKTIYDSMKVKEEQYEFYVLDNTNNQKEAVITYNGYIITSFLNLINTYDLDTAVAKTYKNQNNEIFASEFSDYNENMSYTVKYYSESAYDEDVLKFAMQFNTWKYYDHLESLEWGSDEVSNIIHDLLNASDYYVNTLRDIPQNIIELAYSITKDCDSDIEKAIVLEKYFKESDFTYDLSYAPPEDEDDIEYFIFESKTGICTDFATAMTLMARAAGLPARYVEGYVANEKDNDEFVVRANDAHAFTEVYISGIGWMTFDATVPSDSASVIIYDDNVISDFIKNINATMVLIFCISLLAVFILFQLLSPVVKEACFRISLKSKDNETKIILIFRRMQKLLSQRSKSTHVNMTCGQLMTEVKNQYGLDISLIAENVNRVIFGKYHIDKNELKNSYKVYKSFYKLTRGKK